MERWHVKLICLILMFVIVFVFVLLPIKVSGLIARQGKNAAVILGVLRCFAGGVFLGLIMLHMVPETHDQVTEFLLEPRGIDYPVAEVTLVGGFFLILVFERTILYCESKRKMKKHQAVNQTMNNNTQNSTSPLNEVIENSISPTSTPKANRKDMNGHLETNRVSTVSESVESAPNAGVLDENDIAQTRSIILILALSFESIFDGLSVGMQLTQQGTWNMFGGIVAHEFIIAFCMGIELIKHHPWKRVVLGGFFYALIPVIGCTIGILVTELNSDIDEATLESVSGLLVAFSAGIFFYCTFIGILGEELINNCTYKKILAVFIGCGIMAGLAALPEGGDDEEEEELMTTALPMLTGAVM